MKRQAWGTLFSFLLVHGLASSAWAVIIFENGKDEPIHGYLVAADEIRVIVEEVLPGGETRERILPRSSIDQMIETVQPDRLAELDPANPQSYRNYADDLSEKRRDPDARRTAERLYLIAAHLSPDTLGRGCMLALADLATREIDQRKYRAMAYLLDSTHNRNLLDSPPSPSPTLEREDRLLLLSGLRILRTGRGSDAATFSRRENFQDVLAPFRDYLTIEQYRDGATNGVSDDLLRRVVALELLISVPSVSVPATPPRAMSWSAARLDQTVTELSLDAVGPFDPRKNLYRDGKWVEAD